MAKNNNANQAKSAKAYLESLEATNRLINNQNSAIKGLADVTGIAYSGFIQQQEKSNDQKREDMRLVAEQKKLVSELEKDLGKTMIKAMGLSESIGKGATATELFSKASKSINFDAAASGIKDIHSLESKIIELKKSNNNSEEEINLLNQMTDLKYRYYESDKINRKEVQKDIEDAISAGGEFLETLNRQAVNINNIAEVEEFIKKTRAGSADIAADMLTSGAQYNGLAAEILEKDNRRREENKVVSEMIKEQNNLLSNQVSISETVWKTIEATSKKTLASIYSSMLKNNQIFKDTQRDYGLMFTGNYGAMASMTSEAAKFGMSVEGATKMMGQLGEELATTDTLYLMGATEKFSAIEKATGLSSENISSIAGEMMRAGKSAGDVKDFMEESNQTAKLFGVNTKKTMEGVARNIDKMRQMGFTGGEASLVRMVATADRLKMNIDEIFDVAKRARTIEGAMDMASELQLAGGSFSAINPMDLLSAARKGPEELQKILTQMGGDIGTWDADNKELQFDPIDVDRLQIVADATGQSLDSIQKMIQSNAQDAQKAQFIPDLQMGEITDSDGKPVDQDMLNNMISDSIDMDGAVIEGSMLSEAGIKDIKSMTSEQAATALQDHINKKSSLEDQAQQNQSLMDSITALKDSAMNMLSAFQPIIQVFTNMIQYLNKAPGWAKMIFVAVLGFAAIMPKLIEGFRSYRDTASTMVKGFKDFASGFRENGIKGAFGKAFGRGDVASQASPESASDTSRPGSGGGLSSLAEGLAKMGGEGVLKGIGNLLLAAPVLVLFIPAAILALPALALAGKMHDSIVRGFEAMALGLVAMGDAKVISGIASLLLAVVPLLMFIPAALIALPAMGVAGIMGELIKKGFTSLADGLGYLGDKLGPVAKGALGLVLVGASLIPFAFAAQTMNGIDWMGLLSGVGVLALVVAGILGIGLLLSNPIMMFVMGVGIAALIGLGAGLLVASVGLLAAGVAFQSLSTVDWGGISSMGGALMSATPGLLAFSIASMAFLNPFAIMGIISMTFLLGALASVMIPLGNSMVMAADGMERFAGGLEKLQSAAKNLDFERLEALKDMSIGMASSGSGGSGDAIQKIAEALATLTKTVSGGSESGGNKKIEINLKLNGRQIQEFIVDDTSIVS